MKKNWLTTVFLSLITCAALAGCTQAEDKSTTDDELSVVTSFYPMYEFTRQVAGNRADVSMMVSAGEDAHHYEPSAKDIAGVNEADVFVYSSEEMEHWVGVLLDTLENDDLVVARTADGISEHTHGHEYEQEGGKESEIAGGLTIQGMADHYHTGDLIELTAESKEDMGYDNWHWYIRESADEEWTLIPNQGESEFKYEATRDSMEVRAVLLDHSNNEHAQSEPVEIVIENHENNHNHEEDGHDVHDHYGEEDHGHDHKSNDTAETIEIVGLADHYHTGDVVTLVAELEEEVEFNHWHWYIRRSQDEEWETVTAQETDHFEYETTGESFEVKAVFFNDEHNIYAESAPVSVLIDDHASYDPHIWLDPVLAQAQVNVIRDALIKADPEGQAIYEENAEAFNEKLQALHEDYKIAFQGAENRIFVVQHQAFGYLAERYQLEQIAIGGLSTEVEPSPSRIVEIGKLVTEYDVPVIYYQQGASSAIAETVAAETGTETAFLYDLEVLFEELKAEDLKYLDAMRENLKALQLSIH